MSGEPEPCRVVICDDQESFRSVVSVVLALDPGIEVVGEGADGLEAIELAERLRPDVLLLDVAMPELDGLEALPRIQEVAPETQVVILTGVTAASVRERALTGGARAFIEKGLDVDELGERIKRVCRSTSAAG